MVVHSTPARRRGRMRRLGGECGEVGVGWEKLGLAPGRLREEDVGGGEGVMKVKVKNKNKRLTFDSFQRKMSEKVEKLVKK